MTINAAELDRVIAAALDERELSYQRKGPGAYFVALPGTKKLQTNCWVVLGEHGLVVEAFVCRHPDEAHAEVYRFLLRRNAKLYGVHYTVDGDGDIYLIGRRAMELVTTDELDRILGQVVEAADGDFNALLEIGFAGSIRREWEWRISRGESTANLRAFQHLLDGPNGTGPRAAES